MKHTISRITFAAAALLPASAFAWANGAISRPVTEFDLMGSGNAVTLATPASTGATQSRHLQQVTLSVLDAMGAVVPDATCTASNEKGTWTGKSGDTITIRRSGGNLHISCARNGHVVASAPVRINVATGPFGGNTVATVPQYPGAIAMPAASNAVSSTAPN